MAMRAPLPVRDGVGPTRLRVPRTGPWATIADYVTGRFDHIDPEILLSRFDRAEVVAFDGTPLTRETALGAEDFIWYYREPPDEPDIPYEVAVRHVDDDLLVVDKPHFLPTTPGGGFLRNSALVRLRQRFDNPDLTPIHRLDRATAGLVMFSVRPATRGAYQKLFADRVVDKVYEAVTSIPGAGMPELPLTVRSHLTSTRGSLRAVVHEDREPNAETRVEAIRIGATTAHLRLHPRTGRMHQLRSHLAGIGLGILGDRFYPDLLDEAPDDPDRPLQLLARELRFVDPLSGRPREFSTGLALREADRL
jgi:tRNA pseudouridine32 synthase/23S rRNA pseudouridine746 synthase